MKKIILTALVAVASVAANAQAWIGGEAGYNTSKTTIDGTQTAKSNSVTFLPEVGYSLDENFDIAVAIGYAHGDSQATEHSKTSVNNSFILKPYVRYTYAKVGDLKFFVDGGFGYVNTHVSGVDDNVNTWTIGINPGLAYSLSPKTTLVAHVGDLSYSFSKQGDLKTNAFNLGVDNTVTFGVYFAF